MGSALDPNSSTVSLNDSMNEREREPQTPPFLTAGLSRTRAPELLKKTHLTFNRNRLALTMQRNPNLLPDLFQSANDGLMRTSVLVVHSYKDEYPNNSREWLFLNIKY